MGKEQIKEECERRVNKERKRKRWRGMMTTALKLKKATYFEKTNFGMNKIMNCVRMKLGRVSI